VTVPYFKRRPPLPNPRRIGLPVETGLWVDHLADRTVNPISPRDHLDELLPGDVGRVRKSYCHRTPMSVVRIEQPCHGADPQGQGTEAGTFPEYSRKYPMHMLPFRGCLSAQEHARPCHGNTGMAFCLASLGIASQAMPRSIIAKSMTGI